VTGRGCSTSRRPWPSSPPERGCGSPSTATAPSRRARGAPTCSRRSGSRPTSLPHEERLERLGLTFLFAPAHHPALRHAAPVRRELGCRTIFNLLGPLANPAFATHQLVGIYDPARLEQYARVLGRRTAAESARILERVLAGEPGPARTMTLLNAAAALCAAGVTTDRREAAARAAEAIDSGAARAKLEALRSHRVERA
jgi:anthranilate phosphoribosyltransferase